MYYCPCWSIFLCWNGLAANPGSWSHVVPLLVLAETLMLNLFLQLLPLVVKVISARWHQVEQMACFFLFFFWLVFQVRSCCCDVKSYSFWTINFTYILFSDFDLPWEILIHMQFKYHMANSKIAWKDTFKQTSQISLIFQAFLLIKLLLFFLLELKIELNPGPQQCSQALHIETELNT